MQNFFDIGFYVIVLIGGIIFGFLFARFMYKIDVNEYIKELEFCQQDFIDFRDALKAQGSEEAYQVCFDLFRRFQEAYNRVELFLRSRNF